VQYKWRQQLTLPATHADTWNLFVNHFQNGVPRPEEFSSESDFDKEAEFYYLSHRWSRSPKLTCRVTKKLVSVLKSTDFDDLQVSEIYLPDGVDCFQLIVEQDDPFVNENMIFVRPEKFDFEEYLEGRFVHFKAQYYLVSGVGSKIKGIMNVNPSMKIGAAIDLFNDPIANPVDPRYLSIIAAVGFLADSDQQSFYRHCVLKNDEEKYRRASLSGDKQAMRFLEDRAIRRGKNERIFDTFSIEMGESDPQETSSSSYQGASKRPHLRRGHFRAIRHGEGRRNVRMQWIPPVVVRRDLLAES